MVVITMALVGANAIAADVGPDFRPLPDYCTPNPPEDCAWRDNFSICNIETEVTVAGGGGSGTGEGSGNMAPVIKAKWEYDLQVEFKPAECVACDCNLPSECFEAKYNTPEGPEDYWHRDACPCIDGLQVLPRLGKTVKVGYYAVVTDPEGISTIEHVYADVWHPDGEFKYQIELHPLTKAESIEAFDKVISCHPTLLTVEEDSSVWVPEFKDNPIEDIEYELTQDLALVYYGEAELDYCQPGGYYTVGVRAHDYFNIWSAYLYNQFWYIPTTAIKIDFDSVDYGTAVISRWQWASGDQTFGTDAYPTIQNWGNTPVDLYVWQDDMDFGKTSGEWNVEFDARLGSDGNIKEYDPFENEDLTHKGVKFAYLELCTLDKLDFSIHVKKADPGYTYTGKMCLLGYRRNDPVWDTPDNFIENAPGQVVQDIYDLDPAQSGPGPSQP